jgi:fatty-acyl-CoA synthase
MGVVNNAVLWAERVGIPDGAAFLTPMPLFHTGGCVVSVLGALGSRGTLVLMPGFDPALMLALAESERAGVMGGVPTMIIAAMQHPDLATRDLSSVRGVFSGGAQVPEALVRGIEDTLGVDFTIIYGQTECSPVLTNTFPSDTPEDKGQTVGPPLPHTEVRIVDPVSLETVQVGERGELWARGYCTMIEYFDKPTETADTLLPDGWLRTGDLATMDERGYCRIVGRLKDMIIRGGENVYPREVEEFLYAHPDIVDVQVIGVPDLKYGEEIMAWVKLRSGAVPLDADAVRRFCLGRIAHYKVPRYVQVVEEFPMTVTGKVQKYVMRVQAIELLGLQQADDVATA